jgi:hypothetical protein
LQKRLDQKLRGVPPAERSKISRQRRLTLAKRPQYSYILP